MWKRLINFLALKLKAKVKGFDEVIMLSDEERSETFYTLEQSRERRNKSKRKER